MLLFVVLGPVNTEPLQNTAPKAAEVSTAAAENRTYGLPVRLLIPKIDVDARVTYMGLTASGDMEAPKTNEDAGWYKYGARPGNIGSAVIAGHLGVGNPAVFADLGLLVKGDTLSVIDDDGQSVSFIVTDTRTYEYDTEPSEVFSSEVGAHLNLITCNGNWNSTVKTYSQRLVIFTDKV